LQQQAVSTLRLFLTESHLLHDSADEFDWRLLDGPVAGRGRASLGNLPTAHRLEVYLPPSLVFRAEVTLPPGGRRQARKLLVHALDTVLLGDPTTQHLAYALEGDRCRVAAIEQRRLVDLLARFNTVGRRVSAIYAADMLLASDGGSLLWYGNGWARRHGSEAHWFDASDASAPPPLLIASLKQTEHIVLALAEPQDADLHHWQLATGISVTTANGDPFSAPLASDAINLLQGEFASGPQLDIDWARFRPTLQLAGAALVLATLTWVGQWWSWHREEVALKRGMDSAFVAAFPGTPVIDAQLQLQAKLRTGAAPVADDPLSRLVALAPEFVAGGEVKLLGIEFADGHINADYRAKPEQLAALVQRLGQHGQVQPTAAATDRVRLTLTPRP
jgi:type II secretion system protein L